MLRRVAFLAVSGVLVACGGASNESAFDEPAADTGTASGDSAAPDTTPTGEDATITDTDVPPSDDTGVPPVEDTGTPVEDTGSPVLDTGVPPVDTGIVDTGVPPTDGGVKCTEDGAKTYMGHCYFLISSRTFTGARDACAAAGAHLATVTSAGEQAVVSTVGSGERWIGLAIFSGSTTFRWITSEPMTYMNWAMGEPNRTGYCARLRTDGWADISCSQSFPAICERE